MDDRPFIELALREADRDHGLLRVARGSTTPADGATLEAWHLPAAGAKTTKLVLFCRGGEGNMADDLRKVDALRTSGHNVLTFDDRGFGKSSDFAIDQSMFVNPHFRTT